MGPHNVGTSVQGAKMEYSKLNEFDPTDINFNINAFHESVKNNQIKTRRKKIILKELKNINVLETINSF